MDEKDVNRFDESAEELDEAARRSYRAAVDRAFTAREGNVRLARSFFDDWVDTLETQAEVNRRTLRGAELAREQQETFREFSQQSLAAYDRFLDSLSSYYKEILDEEPEEEPADN